MSLMRTASGLAMVLGAVALVGCAHKTAGGETYKTAGFHPFSGGKPPVENPAAIGVNGYLWRASLDTLA